MTQIRRMTLFVSLMLVLVGGLLFPFGAFAQQNDFASQAGRGAEQVSILAKLIAVFCYVIGVYFAYKSLMALKGFIEKADDNPVTHFLAYVLTSALLIYLPYTIGVTANTVDVKTASSVKSAAANVSVDGDFVCPPANNIGGIFCNMASSLRPTTGVMSLLIYALAGVLILMALLSLKDYGDDPSRVPLRSIVIKLVLACFLISLPLAMEVFMTSVTGDSNFSSAQKPNIKRPRAFSGSITGGP